MSENPDAIDGPSGGATRKPVVSVRGNSYMETEPEIVKLSITVRVRDADRAKTMRLLDERARAVDAVVHRFDESVEKFETGRLQITPVFKDARYRERIVAYSAVVARTLTLSGFDRLGEVVAQLADLDSVDIGGPWWSLRPDSPVYRQARVDAVGEALARARDYAGALGCQVTGLVELADSQLLTEGLHAAFPLPTAARPGAARASAAAPAEFSFDLTPVAQDVRASVEARFEISAPAGEVLQGG